MIQRECFQEAISLVFWENTLLDIGEVSYLEVDESIRCSDGHTRFYIQQKVNVGSKTSGIDVNSECSSSRGRKRQLGWLPVCEWIIEVNNVFWEQFLTENPGPIDSFEVQRKKKRGRQKKES